MMSLDTLQDAITADIKAAFPGFQVVEFYAEYRNDMDLPACLLDLTEWQKFDDPDAGTEQQSVTARFEALIIIRGVQAKNSKRAIRRLMADLTVFMSNRRWTDAENPGKKLRTGPADFLGAYPDNFNPDLDQFEVWRLEWDQVLHLGTSVWDGAEFPRERVFAGISPLIGADHEQDYIELTGTE